MYRSWFALGGSGLLGGVAVVCLFAGFSSPVFFGVAAGAGIGAVLAYRYAAERMVAAVYEGVDPERGREPGTTDRETASRATDGGAYDDWEWASRDDDDPFWSDDEDDWEDPWAWERTDPEEAARGWSWEAWRRERTEREHGRWWDQDDEDDRRRATGDDEEGEPFDPYAVLGLDPDADGEAVRAAYRERVKEAHPDNGGSVEAFLRVREAYERLRDGDGTG